MDASEESLSVRRTDSDSSRLRSRRQRIYLTAGTTLIAVLLAGFRWWMTSQPMDDGVLAFWPPTASEREAAIGDISELPLELQRAFRPSDDFPPIAKPGPRDWLAQHFEGGQSFAEFVRSEPIRLDERRVIYLQPIGEFESDNAPSLDKLRAFTEAYFTLETKLMPTLTLAPNQVTTRVREGTERPQWLASNLLAILEPQLPPDAYCLVGVTLTDLFSSSTPNFVFGQATIRNRTGVFSFARFDPAFYDEPRPADVQPLILRRSCHTLAHEICHIFGMHHCIYFSCPVNGSNHLAENDSRPMHLCPVCLRKLHSVVGFDPDARDRDLLTIYERFGFVNEAEWTQRRLARTANP